MENGQKPAGEEPQTYQVTSASPENPSRARQASRDQSASASQGSANSMRSVASPTLSPWHGQDGGPMVSSVISALDLESHDSAASEQHTTDELASALGHSHSTSSSAVRPGDGDFDDQSGTVSRQSTPSSVSTPLAPRDVLSSTPAPQRLPNLPASSQIVTTPPATDSTMALSQSTEGTPSTSVNGVGNQSTGEDSALEALLEAHGRQTSSSAERPPLYSTDSTSSRESTSVDSTAQLPSSVDASFGLDPDADTRHTVQGTPFRPLFSSPLRASHTEHASEEHHRHHHTQHSRRDWTPSVYDTPEASGASHTSAATGAPHTTHSNIPNTETVPTVSATGLPRIFPRRTSRSPSPANSDDGQRRRQKRHSSRHGVSDDEDEDGYSSSVSDDSHGAPPPETRAGYAPSGSLTMALFSPGLGWRRRSALLLASAAINIGLPFLNGVMLGFGEIFARSIVAPWLGLAPAAININAPAATNASVRGADGSIVKHGTDLTSSRRGNTASVGLRP